MLYQAHTNCSKQATFSKQVIIQRKIKILSEGLRLPDVLESQELSLNLLSKRVVSLILEKHLVVLEYFPASLKILEYF